MPKASPKKKAAIKESERVRVAIVAADFNEAIVRPMIDKAIETLERLECEVDIVLSVPGAFELPLVLDAVLQRNDVDAAVALGFIERGETLHGEVMGHVVYKAILDLQLMYGKPVGIGIIGPGAVLKQAKKRNVAYGEAAAEAAVYTLVCLEDAAK
jgi:6,7-dimethyl-8-ribityllumazine synthase